MESADYRDSGLPLSAAKETPTLSAACTST